MLREGSFALAPFGRVRKVHEPAFAVAFGRKSVALKRILDAAFCTAELSWRGDLCLAATYRRCHRPESTPGARQPHPTRFAAAALPCLSVQFQARYAPLLLRGIIAF